MTRPSQSKRVKPLPFWNDDIKKAIRDRNRARNKMNHTRNIDDCIEYQRLKSIAQQVIRSTAQQQWQTFCSEMTTNTKLTTVWKMVKKMNGIHVNPTATAVHHNGTVVDKNEEKAEVFAQAFAAASSSANYTDKFRKHKEHIEQNCPEMYANDAPNTDTTELLNMDFQQRELHRAILQPKKNTATGHDQVAYEFLQQLPSHGRDVILSYYNIIWRRGQIPKAWKHAIVLPILKGGKDPRLANSYRPISLTSTLCKLMERLITNRLVWYLEKFNLLNNTQSGFRRHRSTADQIIRLQDFITRYQNNKGHVLAVFIDFQKAFDMVWTTGLMIKLKRLGINGKMYNWLYDFFQGRTLQVRVGSSLSSTYTLENGTSQGSMISPECFVTMIDDLPSVLTNTETSLFADDSAIYKAGRNVRALQKAIQRDLDNLQEWCDSWGFKISLDKTVAILFTNARETQAIQLEMQGTPIKVEKKTKFLGMIFDTRLTWKDHVDYVAAKCNKRLNLMRAVSGTN